jgi:1-acyl-sn-glycerol-3-phosphate acyltransferase
MKKPVQLLKGSFASIVLALNVLVATAVVLPLALVKLALPFRAVRRVVDRLLSGVMTAWVGVNSGWIDAVTRARWDISGLEALIPGGWYLVVSNHQSWVDILVLQKLFNRRIPPLKFFLKRELIYVPVIGLAWWALDFPFMQRRGGTSSRKDLERARLACEKFRVVPTSVINFLEGTRFTQVKHDAQSSPYKHLLKPKVGGLATALTTMGDCFNALVDVTILYPQGPPSFWELLSGQVHEVVVRVRSLPIPAEFVAGDYLADRSFRDRMQDWINQLWVAKDGQLADLKRAAASRA